MSEDDKHLAVRFLKFLEARLKAGTITPERPMTSTGIISEAAKSGITLSERKIQQLVRYLRTDPEYQVLIGSSSGERMGYALCGTPKEFQEMNGHLKSRAINDFAAYSLPLKKALAEQNMKLEFEDHPVVKALMEQFECVRV